MVNFIYTECRLQNIELKLDELKTIETSILTQDTRRHSLPGKIRLEKRFYVVFVGNLLDSDPGHQETLATRQDQVRQKFYIVFEGNLLNTGLGQ